METVIGSQWKLSGPGFTGLEDLQDCSIIKESREPELPYRRETQTNSLWYKEWLKENGRMLSKKMVFSLVRLLTIFAPVFVVLSAIAGDFEVKIEGRTMVIYAAGETTVGVKLKVIADKPLPNPLLANFSVFDKDGFLIAIDVDNPEVTVTDDTDYAMRTGTVRQLDINIPVKINDGTVAQVVITVPKTATTDPTVPAADNMSKMVHHTITLLEVPVANPDIPKVVSIQRLRPSTQTVTSAFEETEVRGAFNVRIVLTEKPYDFKLDTINVEGGIASDLVVGVPLAWQGGRNADGSRNLTETLVPHPSEGMYAHTLSNVAPGADSVTVPLPSGDDDMYYQYRVTITPHYGVGIVKISIKEFHDNALPSVNVYTPMNVAHKPNGREQLRLAVATDFATFGAEATLDSTHEESTQVTAANGTPRDDLLTKDEDSSGASPLVDVAKAKVVEEADTSVPIPMEGKIYISEIMFAGGGVLPQWIEIANSSQTEQVNLSGWTLKVENATTDADVSVSSKATFTIPEGMKISPSGQNDTPSTILVVTEQGRNNIDTGSRGASQIFNLWTEQQIVLFLLNVTKRRYSLLSEIAFKITLVPPGPDGTPPVMDVVGNLADDGTVAWALPVETEGDARSSIIRRHVSVEPEGGEMMESWVLASDTGFTQGMHATTQSYYGLPIDVGTPGFRAGGTLPVELSYFRPARDKVTGTVVITWSTESELNNAGFFIKRSQQRNGEFKVINATMIAGTGTTSEKQFYTYTDTTAQPNVVYYYQIEDVSLDGNRQTLTNGIRLKGHVGTAGKLTTTWGDLKTSNE